MRSTFHIILFFICFISTTYGQNKFSSENFSLSIGLNTVDNTGNNNPFSIFNQTEDLAFKRPIEIFINYDFNAKIQFFLGASFNEFKQGQIVNQLPITENLNYRSIDTGARYFFYNLTTGNDSCLKPYIHAGLALYSINETQLTANTGIGVQYHISPSVGFYVNSTARFSFSNTTTESNHFQYSIGVILKPFGNCSTCGMY